MSSWRQSASYIVFHQISFLLTGLTATLGVQWLFYTGATSSTTFFTQLSNYVGMLFVGCLIPILRSPRSYKPLAVDGGDTFIDVLELKGSLSPAMGDRSKHSDGPIRQQHVMKLSIIDILANSCATLGFAVIGSGMYQVVYSSVVIWCAIMTYLFMGRALTRVQWLAICGTSVGLAIGSLDQIQVGGSDKNLFVFGTMATLGGTFLYACSYVFSDYLFSQQVPPPLPARVCFYNGIYSTCITLMWIVFYTLPRLDSLVQIKPGVTMTSVWSVYAIVTLANATHAWNYYELIDKTGNVATGILQGLRAILVYGISHVWYCSVDAAQCFTVPKGFGSLLIVGCVLLFTVGSKTTTLKKV